MACAICAVISLGGASPLCSMQPPRDWPNPQEGRARMEASSLPSSTDEIVPSWPCSRRGLPGHVHYCARRWSLTPPFHHHPAKRGAVCFCGPFPAGSRLSAVPRPGCYPTSCSMECGLSSIPSTQDRDCPINLRSFDDTRSKIESQPGKNLSYVGNFHKGGHFLKRY